MHALHGIVAAVVAAWLAALPAMDAGAQVGGREGSGIVAADDAAQAEAGGSDAGAADAAVAALRERVRAEAARLRAELDAAQAAEATAGLLARRATVLAALTPAFLLAEAASAARDGGDGRPDAGPELLAAWRVEFRDGPPLARWSSPDGPARVRAALRAWAATGTRAVACTATTRAVRFTGTDAPPTIAWSAAAWGSPCTVHARAWWHEPAGEHEALDFPLSPDGLDLRVEPDGIRLAQDGGAAHGERWAPGPAAFINPPDLYALEDAWRCARAADARAEGVPDGAVSPAPTADALPEASGSAQQVVTRELRRPDGRRLRTEHWHFDGRALRSLVIEQDAALLEHGAPFGYEIVSEVEGDVVERTPHRPTATATAFPAGLRIVVGFRAPDPARDVAPAAVLDDPGAALPERVVFSDGEGAIAAVDIPGLAIVDGAAAPSDATDARHDAEGALAAIGSLAASAQARAEATGALARAIGADDPDAARAAAGTIAALQAADGVPGAAAATAFERACLRALRAGRPRVAEAIARGAWMEAWRRCDAHEQGEAIDRLRAARAEEALAWLGEVPADREGSVTPVARGCDAAVLPPRSQELLAGMRAALGASRNVGRGMALQAGDALCDALAGAGGGVTRDAEHVAAIVAAARAWLEAGRAGLDRAADGEPDGTGTARAFARAVLEAAAREPASAAGTGALRNALARVADAARDATAALGREAGWTRAEADEEASVARDRVRAVAGLVGNPFMPDWMPGETASTDEPPSPRATRDALVHDPVLRGRALRERTRAAIVATVAAPELADARRRAGRRTVARDVADAALRAFEAWAHAPRRGAGGGAKNGQGSDGSPKRPPSDPSAHLPCERHPAGPFPQPEGRASRVPAEAAQPDRRCDCPIHAETVQAPASGSSRSQRRQARAPTGCAACARATAACAGRAGPFSGAGGPVRPPPRASGGSRGRSAPTPPPGCRRSPARWRRAGARTCRG